jgi:hypothetical protein
MKINVTVNIRIGIEQQVKTEDGRWLVRAVYETDSYRPFGYIRKAKNPSGRIIGWAVYTKAGRSIGCYTLREFALLNLIQTAIVQ